MNESRITSHFISAASLLEQINNKVGKLAATQSYTYGALAEFIRHNGKRPEQSMELYQRMVFNAFIGNVDDHTRNHAMLYDFVEQGWFLSPAYDVLPIKNEKSHSLGLGDEGRVATIENLLSQSKRFGLRTDKASKIIRNTRELVSSWPTYFKNEGVNDIDLSILESVLPDIDSW
jgi:serine/threonine-protein kinase HipA